MATWRNSDGLLIVYGTDEGEAGVAGEYLGFGPTRVFEAVIDLTTATSSAAVVDQKALFNKGWTIEKVEVQTIEAVTGTNAALNIGLQRTDGSTELDYDGLGKAAALTQTAMADVGNFLTYIDGTSNAGALVGQELAYNGLLTIDYDTAAFTDGTIVVRVHYSVQA